MPTTLTNPVILAGHGIVGSHVSRALRDAHLPFIVVDTDGERLTVLHNSGFETFTGNCGENSLLQQLNLAGARVLISTVPDPYEAGHIIEAARTANSSIWIIAKAQNSEGVAYLKSLGDEVVFTGQEEIAARISQAILANVTRSSNPPKRETI